MHRSALYKVTLKGAKDPVWYMVDGDDYRHLLNAKDYLWVARRLATDYPDRTVIGIALARVKHVNVKGMVVREQVLDSTPWNGVASSS